MTRNEAQQYIDAGFALCAVKPGTKAPKGMGWQYNARTADHWDDCPDDNMGFIHSLSGTCTIDIDDMNAARDALEAIGINMDGMLSDGDMVHIDSGREGRGKLIFKAPDDLPKTRHALNWPTKDGTDQFCVIEFRAGQTQDALPPSIHPDTGKPYVWRGDWRNLPPLPESLKKVWVEWALAKDAMQDACPWADKKEETRVPTHAPLSYVPSAGAGGDVIGQFNTAVNVGDILERNGYKKAGRRWLAPNSGTGIPGVVRLPNSQPVSVYSFHGSDLLCDEHAHDAFSLYMHLEQDGDMTKAVKCAADYLGLDPQPVDEDIKRMAANIMNGTRAKADQPQEPATERPNVTNLQDFVKDKQGDQQKHETAPKAGPIPVYELEQVKAYLASQVASVKPDAIIQTVMAFACAVTMRRYKAVNGQPTTTFFGISDSSTAGLRPLRDKVYRLCAEIGERRMIRGTGITGGHVLYQSYLRYPRMFWATDEYGTMVMRTRKQTSGAIESALATLHDLYTGNTMYIDPDTATTGKPRDIKECDIHAPCLTMLALLGDRHVSAMTNTTEYARGTLQQMLLIPAGDESTSHLGSDQPDVKPAGLLEKVKRLNAMPGIPGNEDNPTSPPTLSECKWDKDTGSVFKAAHARYKEIMDTPERQPFRGMAYGYQQSAIRLASALAAWANPERPIVTPELAGWACQWCERCLVLSVPRIEIASGTEDGPDMQEMVMTAMLQQRQALSSHEIGRICRPFRNLKRADREEVLTLMVEDGMVVAERGPRTVRYSPATVTS